MTEAKARSRSRHLVTLLRWCVQAVLIVIAVLATLLLVQAFGSRKKPDLEAWHTPLEGEFTAGDLTPGFGLAQYLDVEQALRREMAACMVAPDDLQGRSPLLRYVRGGKQNPSEQNRDWNWTIEFAPDAPKGGVVLLHGLSDSPYSMRSLAELYVAQDYHVLVMRMPGHGAVPAGLLEATWQDWAAAVEVGVRHVESLIDATAPLHLVGYSNGGALAVHHCLTRMEQGGRVPDRLFLCSPAIGITPFARVARWDALYGFIPYFEKSKWLDIMPEFDPYKYNSFPKNAGTQSWRLARAIQTRLDELETAGRLGEIPPILTFQSVVDDTVVAVDLITGLYDRLESEGSEVVFYDVSRATAINGFVSHAFSLRLGELMQRTDLKYTITRITNRGPQTLEMCAESRGPGADKIVTTPLDAEWPDDVFSLAHVAIPFPPDDPLYGTAPSDAFGISIGSLVPRGERRVMTIPASQFIRIRHNPFHEDLTRRILAAMKSDA